MLWVIGLPFATLVAAIVVVRTMRGARRLQELRAPRETLTADSARRKPSDEYHDGTWLPLCRRVAEAAATQLDRSLTEKERRAIWRARSELVLNVALSEIDAADDPQTVTDILAAMPTGMDRPDPTAWSIAGS